MKRNGDLIKERLLGFAFELFGDPACERLIQSVSVKKLMFKLCVIMKQNNISLIKLSSIFYLTKQCGWKDKGIKSCLFSKESLPAVPA